MNEGYRSGARCEFCTEEATADCPRCLCHICAAHGLGEFPFCAVCQKEARDDAELAQFKSAVAAVDEEGAFGQRSTSVFIAVLGWLGRNMFRVLPPRAASAKSAPSFDEKPFGRRSLADIRAWRKSAGIRTRG